MTPRSPLAQAALLEAGVPGASPDDAAAHLASLAQDRPGSLDDARDELRRVLEQAPDDWTAVRALILVRLAEDELGPGCHNANDLRSA